MNDDEVKSAYTVVQVEGSFEVRTPEGRRVMACNDSSSASHYALMLNEAFRAGYRQALRDQHAVG
ncbi:MAG: hypothetical protein MUP31_04510 [Xanthomonadales bacterium]|nr:hypothetical protein [Xanthomonadales bacterium]